MTEPRQLTPAAECRQKHGLSSQTRVPEMSAFPALCILGQSDETLWGRTPAERLQRQFALSGVTRVLTLTRR
jgi:hypothetical protein